MAPLYVIGGSPCSGKSTVAEQLAKAHDLFYFKVDDFLDGYTARGVAENFPVCKALSGMSPEQIWMRDPQTQCKEELAFYHEIFPFVLEDLKKLQHKAVITEGAAFLPSLLQGVQLPSVRYCAITPTPTFQVSHYKQREWVPFVLEGCSDKEAAFANWMQRDILFATEVERQCAEMGLLSIVNDGGVPVEAMVQTVTRHFALKAADA